MYLKSIKIENYRLLKNVTIALDKDLTLFVGKNNTGKTSVMHVLESLLSRSSVLSFDDYPLACRKTLYSSVKKYWESTSDERIEGFKTEVPITYVTLVVDYSGDDGNLGNISDFIIDLDENIEVAVIRIAFDISPNIQDVLALCKKQYDMLLSDDADDTKMATALQSVIKKNFGRLFSMRVFAVNPSNYNDNLEKKSLDLQNLFCLKVISAERNMDETDEHSSNPLSKIMNSVFSSEVEGAEADVLESLQTLRSMITETNFSLQNRVNVHMDRIVQSMMAFGYPSADDLNLHASSNIDLEQSIRQGTELTYVSADSSESLPSSHNGLGYKNLIKISLELHDFAEEVKNDRKKLPLLFLEEPEAHMHPQLQTTFVSFVEEFLAKEAGPGAVQTLITTHSSHVANTVSFDRVRYLRRHADYVECKPIGEFPRTGTPEEQESHLDFLQKYMKLSYCDLFFCDKAILVEGASERLLIPDMIRKCNEEGDFSLSPISLTSQYYAIIEVGGAYAHHFYDFLDYLEIPSLILTDIDFVKGSHREKCRRNEAEKSSNEAINRWCRKKLGIIGEVGISQIIGLSDAFRTDGYRHIEFQREENEFHPRSLEDAIMNCNRDIFNISEGDNPDFESLNEKKTDFALKLLMNDSCAQYKVPSYIRDGLIWLNNHSSTGA